MGGVGVNDIPVCLGVNSLRDDDVVGIGFGFFDLFGLFGFGFFDAGCFFGSHVIW